MRRISWLVGLLLLVGGTAIAAPASAGPSTRCSDGFPRQSYTAAALAATLSIPIAPCRSGRLPATVALTLSVTRCAPVVGCGFATTASTHCRGTSGNCVLALKVAHGAVEFASYYVESTATGFSGEYISGTTTSSSGGIGCVSAAVTASC